MRDRQRDVSAVIFCVNKAREEIIVDYSQLACASLSNEENVIEIC